MSDARLYHDKLDVAIQFEYNGKLSKWHDGIMHVFVHEYAGCSFWYGMAELGAALGELVAFTALDAKATVKFKGKGAGMCRIMSAQLRNDDQTDIWHIALVGVTLFPGRKVRHDERTGSTGRQATS